MGLAEGLSPIFSGRVEYLMSLFACSYCLHWFLPTMQIPHVQHTGACWSSTSASFRSHYITGYRCIPAQTGIHQQHRCSSNSTQLSFNVYHNHEKNFPIISWYTHKCTKIWKTLFSSYGPFLCTWSQPPILLVGMLDNNTT